MNKTKVLVVDDYPMLREGITLLLQEEPDIEVVGQASDGEEAVRLASEKCPDVVLMDSEMPKADGLKATRLIRANNPAISILVLTVYDDEDCIPAFMEAGARGYLLKTSNGNELIQAVRALTQGFYILHTQNGPQPTAKISLN